MPSKQSTLNRLLRESPIERSSVDSFVTGTATYEGGRITFTGTVHNTDDVVSVPLLVNLYLVINGNRVRSVSTGSPGGVVIDPGRSWPISLTVDVVITGLEPIGPVRAEVDLIDFTTAVGSVLQTIASSQLGAIVTTKVPAMVIANPPPTTLPPANYPNVATVSNRGDYDYVSFYASEVPLNQPYYFPPGTASVKTMFGTGYANPSVPTQVQMAFAYVQASSQADASNKAQQVFGSLWNNSPTRYSWFTSTAGIWVVAVVAGGYFYESAVLNGFALAGPQGGQWYVGPLYGGTGQSGGFDSTQFPLLSVAIMNNELAAQGRSFPLSLVAILYTNSMFGNMAPGTPKTFYSQSFTPKDGHLYRWNVATGQVLDLGMY